MNLILISPDQLTSDNRAILKDEQFVHAIKILKVTVGSSLKVGLLNSEIGNAIVTAIESSHLEIEFSLDQPPTPALPITLVVAMSRPQTIKKVLSIATVMGVKEIFFLQTKRVQKSYWDSPVLKDESLFRHLHEGLQQTVDTVMPMVHFRKRFKPFIEDELPLLLNESKGIVFHPTDKGNKLSAESGQRYTYLIGPEGGFIDYEIEKILEAGVEVVSLGRRIMRVEQAINAILGFSSISLDI